MAVTMQAVDVVGKQFMINPNQRLFSLIRASDLLLLNAVAPMCYNNPTHPTPPHRVGLV
jgi:hypothetical protein